jgi:phosphotransferase system  glucose/maltose/N-acetylglucosamine-specific IIC component
MKTKLLNKSWLTPVTTLVFLVTALSGILLLFHVRSGFLMTLHEWMGFFFVLAGILHMICNWNSLKKHFVVKTAIIPFAVILSFVLIVTFTDNSKDSISRYGDDDRLEYSRGSASGRDLYNHAEKGQKKGRRYWRNGSWD